MAQIEQAEQRKATIAAQWCETGFYERTSKDEIGRLEREEAALGLQITELMAKWEAIEEEIAALSLE
jgi:hypothetical protein